MLSDTFIVATYDKCYPLNRSKDDQTTFHLMHATLRSLGAERGCSLYLLIGKARIMYKQRDKAAPEGYMRVIIRESCLRSHGFNLGTDS